MLAAIWDISLGIRFEIAKSFSVKMRKIAKCMQIYKSQMMIIFF
jgi:hypothetical protein